MGANTWMDEARQVAAQCWCDEETKDRVMDHALAEAVARRIAAWMDTAMQFSHNDSGICLMNAPPILGHCGTGL